MRPRLHEKLPGVISPHITAEEDAPEVVSVTTDSGTDKCHHEGRRTQQRLRSR